MSAPRARTTAGTDRPAPCGQSAGAGRDTPDTGAALPVSTYTVALVACSATKLERAAPARDLYTGQLFRAARRWAEAHADVWYVLSALHGVVGPDEVLEPYDKRLRDLRDPACNMTGRESWAIRCRGELMGCRGGEPRGARVIGGDRVVFLTGHDYWEHLAPRLAAWGAVVETPLARLGIGRQKQWLAQWVKR